MTGSELKHWIIDTAERAVFTFLESFLGLLLISSSDLLGSSLSPDLIEAAVASGLIAALAVVKASVASAKAGLSPASLARVSSGSDEG